MLLSIQKVHFAIRDPVSCSTITRVLCRAALSLSFTDDKLNATSYLDEWQMHENVLQGRRNQRVLVGYPWTS